MARLCLFAMLVVLPLTVNFAVAGGKQEKDIKIDGTLTKNDPKDKRGGPAQTHSVQLKAGKTYTIDMVATTQFDAYMRLLESNGNQLDEDDDSGGNLNSRIIFNCSKDGEYKIVCTTYGPDMAGSYTLTVKSNLNKTVTTTPHQNLIGKPAPEMPSGSAPNGKAIQMSDYKGKVVLVHFWDIRSGECVEAFKQLREWHKAYQADGDLAIVGVTFYPSELGQKLGFDKTGKLTVADKADRQSDQAMFQAFADHHKINHVLMALSKDQALKTFEDYAVNSVPQFVMIDRKGMIRFIQVGEKTTAAVGQEIKKLLEEK